MGDSGWRGLGPISDPFNSGGIDENAHRETFRSGFRGKDEEGWSWAGGGARGLLRRGP